MKTLNLGGISHNKLHVVSDVWYAWPNQLANELNVELNYVNISEDYTLDKTKSPQLTIEQEESLRLSSQNPSPFLWLYKLYQQDIKGDDLVIGLVPSCERTTEFKSAKEVVDYCNNNKDFVGSIKLPDQIWHQYNHINAIDNKLNDEQVVFNTAIVFEQLKVFSQLYKNSMFFMFQDHININQVLGIKAYTQQELDDTPGIVTTINIEEDNKWSPMLEWVRTRNSIPKDSFPSFLRQETNNLDKDSDLWLKAINSHILR